MVLFLLFLCVLCLLPVCSIFEDICPRKDPPPGVLVVSPGSSLVLTCGGDVKVNGTTVILPGNNKTRGPTSISRTTGGPDWEDTEKEDDQEDEERKEESRVTRGVVQSHQWKRSKLSGHEGGGQRGEVSVISQEEVLSLDSVTTTDAGRYACHFRGEEKFAVKVFVEGPPETPSLSCNKKSPSSKIRCEWRPQNKTKHQKCHLVVKIKNKTEKRIPCSYSSQLSQWWCTLDYDDNEQRSSHEAILCVTSILGSASSPPVFFSPLGILKLDPPSGISGHQNEGQGSEIKVTWKFPASWNQKDCNHYALVYQIKYSHVTSRHEQVNDIREKHSYTISDALPGEEYRIQLRAKDEYDGHWSEWSPPVYARSWKVKYEPIVPTEKPPTFTQDDLTTWDDLGSGSADGEVHEGNNTDDPSKMPQYVFWISGLVALFSTFLAIYIFRHKDNSFSKLHKRLAFTSCGALSPPAPEAPKGETVLTFVPQLYEERPPSDTQEEEENEEEQSVTGRGESINFNNTSYFFLQSEL